MKQGDHYVVNGSKMFITNARYGTLYSLVVKTDPQADPPYAGISLFAAEKGPGVTVGRQIGGVLVSVGAAAPGAQTGRGVA